jgi:hypothetical protein
VCVCMGGWGGGTRASLGQVDAMRAVTAAMTLQMIPAVAASVGWGENASDALAGHDNLTCSVDRVDRVFDIDPDPSSPSHECRWHCRDVPGVPVAFCDVTDTHCGCCGMQNEDAEVPECSLLAGSFGPLVQAFCALTGFGSLVLKKHFMDDKKGVDRSWAIWGMDVTKQATSGVAAHLAGMINSHFLNRGTGRVGNECSWYFVAFTFDTTCGVMVGYVLLNALQQAAKTYNWRSLQATGNYMRGSSVGIPMSTAGARLVSRGWCQAGIDGSVWFKQMLSWCLITLMARAFIGAVLYLLKGTALLQGVATAVAQPFTCHPDVLLVLVMLGCPLGMNVLQLVRELLPLPRRFAWLSQFRCAAPDANCCAAPVCVVRSQWVQDQFLRDADGSPSKFEIWMQRCRGGGVRREAQAPLLEESLRMSGSNLGQE